MITIWIGLVVYVVVCCSGFYMVVLTVCINSSLSNVIPLAGSKYDLVKAITRKERPWTEVYYVQCLTWYTHISRCTVTVIVIRSMCYVLWSKI